jgi:hypothetical protein
MEEAVQDFATGDIIVKHSNLLLWISFCATYGIDFEIFPFSFSFFLPFLLFLSDMHKQGFKTPTRTLRTQNQVSVCHPSLSVRHQSVTEKFQEFATPPHHSMGQNMNQ